MGRNHTKATKSINRMYEQMNLDQNEILHKTRLLLSVYRDVVWATLTEAECVKEDIYYFGEELDEALVYLENFAPDIERDAFEARITSLFENKWMIVRIINLTNYFQNSILFAL